MIRIISWPLAAALLLTTSACAGKSPASVNTLSVSSAAASSMDGMSMPATIIAGAVIAPAGIVGQNGAGVVANNGNGVLANNGGSMVGQMAMYAVADTSSLTTAPFTNAKVFVADAAGDPIPGLASTTTDANGQYTLKNIPSGTTFVLVAQRTLNGKTYTFETLVNAGTAGATANVDPATTLAAAGVTQDATSDLGAFKPATFKGAADAVRAKLTDTNLPDYSDPKSVVTMVNQLAQQVSELKNDLDQIKSDLAQIQMDHQMFRKEITTLQQEVADLQKRVGISASPSPSPSPMPGMN